MHDIAAIQTLYGADLTTRTGNTTYGFNSNDGKTIDGRYMNPYDFSASQNPNPVFAIYDAGGVDTLDASGFSTSQVIDLRPGAFSSIGELTDNIAMAYEVDSSGRVVGSAGFDATRIVNTIENAKGGSGTDTITGNDANNRLEGGAGNDTLYGGAGSDTLLGGADNDWLSGQAGADMLEGGANDDVLDGGIDTLRDTLRGGDGNDIYYVSANDVVVETATTGSIDTVRTALASYTLGSLVENLEFLGTGTNSGAGNALDNVMRGFSGTDSLNGGDGNDTLHGGEGSDRLLGGNHDDWLYGGGGHDVRPDGTAGLDGGYGSDRLYGEAGDDSLFGGLGAHRDWLYGGAGNDTLDGGAHNDHLYGLDGKDVLTGGAGADTFHFFAVSDSAFEHIGGAFFVDNVDTITDFSRSQGDKINLWLIDANSTGGTENDAFQFLAGPGSYQGDWTGKVWSQVEVVAPGGTVGGVVVPPVWQTSVYVSTDADAGAEMQIDLNGRIAFTATDFIL